MEDQLEFVISYQFYSNKIIKWEFFAPTCIFFNGIYNG